VTVILRPARREDAPDLARLVDLAGEGLPRFVWAGMAEPGEDAWAVGARRASRDEGAFSWRNATVAEVGGALAGCLVGYPIGDRPEPLDEVPPMFRPLQALENRALGSYYVNVLATFPEHRRQGVARALMAEADRLGGMRAMSLIVADRNGPARRLYEGVGYTERGREPIVEEGGWHCASDDWVLMMKESSLLGGRGRRSGARA
jgi:ribosomal protein S18 acetylase RimI-like enzyme